MGQSSYTSKTFDFGVVFYFYLCLERDVTVQPHMKNNDFDVVVLVYNLSWRGYDTPAMHKK